MPEEVKENISTSSLGFEHIDNLKDNLQQISQEIENIRTSFYKGAENLERIKNLLDVKRLDEFVNIIENLEKRVSKIEEEKNAAIEGAKKYSKELEKEKERLVKLWDAYKLQEDELTEKEKKIAELEDQIARFNTERKRLEEEYNRTIETLKEQLREKENQLKELQEFRMKHIEFEREQERLNTEINSLREELKNKEEEIKKLQEENRELRPLKKEAEYKEKYEELSKLYEEERARLAKLYKIYEETEGEANRLREELERWHTWFDSNAELFNKLFKSAEELKGSITRRTSPRTKSKEIESISEEVKKNK
ncbi:MAG: hypothetical protein J7K62_02600 [Thermoplasmata archaeon]|nr:hypothetical protein [Thermoplasmata archaeon]